MALSALDRDSFDKLLEALTPDNRDQAGVVYEELRQRLIRFFSWEGCQRPEDCADEVFNRVASKLTAGERILNIMAFASGVSRLVLKETIRHQGREQSREVLEFPAPKPAEPESVEEQCLDKCFEELATDARELLLNYYRGEASQRIRNRQQMAANLGISLNSLRNRALRLREKLEVCVQGCVAKRDISNRSSTKGEDV
jgi:DNA-directed RNA polymerase specialized sigma24 family protein